MYTFYKPKSKIGESRAEGPDVSEQIAVCLRERPGKSECETCCKIELSQSRQKKNGCPFRIADGRTPYFFLRKKTLADWLAGWLAGWMAGVVGVGGGRWDCWAANTFGFDIHDL